MTSNIYQKLENLLANYKWKEADKETERLMLHIAGREEAGWLDRESINNFPCQDLRTIDQLWVKYSNGRFGFSVQKNIWLECGGKVDYETECKVGNHIGWRVKSWIDYEEATFSIKALPGHLPLLIILYDYVEVRGFYCLPVSALASRATSCSV